MLTYGGFIRWRQMLAGAARHVRRMLISDTTRRKIYLDRPIRNEARRYCQIAGIADENIKS